MKFYIQIVIACILSFSYATSATAQENTQKVQLYLGGKFMVGSAILSVSKYTEANNPSAPARDGKTAGESTQVRWGGGVALGVKIPIIPLIAVRTELEYLHARSAKTFSQGSETKLGFNTNTLLLNGYIDFTPPRYPFINPYIGFGVGVGINELKYTPASIDIGTKTINPINCILQTGIGSYFLLGTVAFDINIRYLYNGTVHGKYVNSAGNAFRNFKVSPHMVEALFSILIFI